MTGRTHTVLSLLLVVAGLFVIRLTTLEIQPWPEGMQAIRGESVATHEHWTLAHPHTLVTWANAVGVKVFGHREIAVRWFAVLSSWLLMLFVFLNAKEILSFRGSLLATVLAIGSIPILTYGRQSTYEMPAVMLLMAVVYFVHQTEIASTAYARYIWAISVGISWGCLLLTSFPLGLLPLVFIARYCYHRRKYSVVALSASLALLLSFQSYYELFSRSEFRESITYLIGGTLEPASLDFALLSGGPFRIIELFVTATPVLSVALVGCIAVLFQKAYRPLLSGPLLPSLSTWFVGVLITLVVVGSSSPISVVLLIPPAAILSIYLLERFMAKSALLTIVSYGAIICSTLWMLGLVLLPSSSSGKLLPIVLAVTVSVVAVVTVLASPTLRMRIAVYAYVPIVYGAIGCAITVAVSTMIFGSQLQIRGGRSVAAALNEDSASVRSFVYLYHEAEGVTGYNPQIDWYLNGWMSGRRKGFSTVYTSLQETTVERSAIEQSYGASWFVYEIPKGSGGLANARRIHGILGDDYAEHLVTPNYVVFRRR